MHSGSTADFGMTLVFVFIILPTLIFMMMAASRSNDADTAIAAAEKKLDAQADYKCTHYGGAIAAFVSSKQLLAGADGKSAKLYDQKQVKTWTVEWLERSRNGVVWKTDFKLRIDLNSIDTPFFRVSMPNETEAFRWNEILTQLFAD